MNWTIVKTGAEMFDAFHAYGIAILLANATTGPVLLRDIGVKYEVTTECKVMPGVTPDILQQVWKLPTGDDLKLVKSGDPVCLAVANLDGLLATVFTTPGLRVNSVADLLGRQRALPSAVEAGLEKVSGAITRWMAYAERLSRKDRNRDWLTDVHHYYHPRHPHHPVPIEGSKSAVNVLMTIDPQWSYSARRAVSDGLLTNKTNITIRGTPYAPLLALIGAARFLRTQRVGANFVNLYVPLVTEATLYPDTALPILYPTEQAPRHGIVQQWLATWKTFHRSGYVLSALAYHVMQTQGAQQSISYERGLLDARWLQKVYERTGNDMLASWNTMLNTLQERLPFETDYLFESLIDQRADIWFVHLYDRAIHEAHDERRTQPYSVEHVREVSKLMSDIETLPLSSILDRAAGTIRFGHSLRQLSQQQVGQLTDLIDMLDVVQTRDQLIGIAARIAQVATVASARSPFAIIPSDADLKHLLNDMDTFTPKTIAKILIVLSALRYPLREDVEQHPQKPKATYPISSIRTGHTRRRKRL